ncbi:MAG: ABC transporter ATP-binding protein [Clostridia bacterium]|nr:ABC transporter ATP-binding protein [Clostridia bacterium]
MQTILRVKNVTKHYGGGSVVTKALDGISLDICEKEFVAVMGASGSGKSSLLNVIATIDRVSSGEILLDGQNLCEMRENELSAFRRDKLGFVFQDYNLLDTLTIGENIVLPLNLQRKSVEETERKLHNVATELGIADQLHKFPNELSGGQRQRAACARAIITSPSLVLADEPTGALDSKNSKLLLKTFQLMNEALGTTILMVTHDAVVGSYASRVLFLKDGKIWSELIRGERTGKQMYNEILSVTAALGGDADVR